MHQSFGRIDAGLAFVAMPLSEFACFLTEAYDFVCNTGQNLCCPVFSHHHLRLLPLPKPTHNLQQLLMSKSLTHLQGQVLLLHALQKAKKECQYCSLPLKHRLFEGKHAPPETALKLTSICT